MLEIQALQTQQIAPGSKNNRIPLLNTKHKTPKTNIITSLSA
jgi:hypothetical protein